MHHPFPSKREECSAIRGPGRGRVVAPADLVDRPPLAAPRRRGVLERALNVLLCFMTPLTLPPSLARSSLPSLRQCTVTYLLFYLRSMQCCSDSIAKLALRPDGTVRSKRHKDGFISGRRRLVAGFDDLLSTFIESPADSPKIM